jgi:chromosome partitioning protein
MIIVFASSKGGVGKSTTCAALGSYLASHGARVHVMDLDQNQTLAVWSERGRVPNLDVAAVTPDKFSDAFRAAGQGVFDHIFIDLAGVREITLMKAIGKADLVVIPAQHSEPDVRQAMTIVSDIHDIEETLERKVPHRVLFTKVRSLRTRLDQFIEEELAREHIARFDTVLVDRISYKEMFLNGIPPHKKEPDRGAGAELAALWGEIDAILASPGNAVTKLRAAG